MDHYGPPSLRLKFQGAVYDICTQKITLTPERMDAFNEVGGPIEGMPGTDDRLIGGDGASMEPVVGAQAVRGVVQRDGLGRPDERGQGGGDGEYCERWHVRSLAGLAFGWKDALARLLPLPGPVAQDEGEGGRWA